jgi:hypothetical protein
MKLSKGKIHGVAMGFPLSPVVANIYMDHFEIRVKLLPIVWKSYVDDMLSKWGCIKEDTKRFTSITSQITSNSPLRKKGVTKFLFWM